MDTVKPLSFKQYLVYDGVHNSANAKKLAKKTPKNKMYGGANHLSNAEKQNNRGDSK